MSLTIASPLCRLSQAPGTEPPTQDGTQAGTVEESESSSELPSWLWAAVGAGVGAVVLIGVVIGAVCFWRRRRAKGSDASEKDFTFSSAYEVKAVAGVK